MTRSADISIVDPVREKVRTRALIDDFLLGVTDKCFDQVLIDGVF